MQRDQEKVKVAVCPYVLLCMTSTYRCSVQALLLSTLQSQGVYLPGFRLASAVGRECAVEAICYRGYCPRQAGCEGKLWFRSVL